LGQGWVRGSRSDLTVPCHGPFSRMRPEVLAPASRTDIAWGGEESGGPRIGVRVLYCLSSVRLLGRGIRSEADGPSTRLKAVDRPFVEIHEPYLESCGHTGIFTVLREPAGPAYLGPVRPRPWWGPRARHLVAKRGGEGRTLGVSPRVHGIVCRYWPRGHPTGAVLPRLFIGPGRGSRHHGSESSHDGFLVAIKRSGDGHLMSAGTSLLPKLVSELNSKISAAPPHSVARCVTRFGGAT